MEARIAALLADGGGRALGAFRIAVDDDDLGAAPGERERGGPADAVAAPVISATLPLKSMALLRVTWTSSQAAKIACSARCIATPRPRLSLSKAGSIAVLRLAAQG